MSTPFQRDLKKHLLHLVEIERRPKALAKVSGFVVSFSDELVLLHMLDWESFRLNGYIAIRQQDIRAYRFFDKTAYWQCRAVKHFRLRPILPKGITTATLPDLLNSLAKHFPLIMFYPERTKPDVCYIGPILSFTPRTITIDDLDCNAEWSGPRKLKLKDITRIEVGGGYEAALARTAPRRRS